MIKVTTINENVLDAFRHSSIKNVILALIEESIVILYAPWCYLRFVLCRGHANLTHLWQLLFYMAHSLLIKGHGHFICLDAGWHGCVPVKVIISRFHRWGHTRERPMGWEPFHTFNNAWERIIWGPPTRIVYFYYISCLRYTILTGNPSIMYIDI